MFEAVQPKDRLHVNLIPLINVVFLLLIFFLVVGTFSMPDNVAVDVPDARSGEKVVEPRHVIVLKDEEQLLYNNKPMSERQVLYALKPLVERNPDTQILLKANAGLAANQLTRLIRMIAGVGATNLLLATELPAHDY